MDGTREGTLRKLHQDFNNPLLSMSTRQKAHRAFNNILRQVNDRTLTELRRRLHRAQIADDEDAVERITMQIDEYSKRAGYTTAG